MKHPKHFFVKGVFRTDNLVYIEHEVFDINIVINFLHSFNWGARVESLKEFWHICKFIRRVSYWNYLNSLQTFRFIPKWFKIVNNRNISNDKFAYFSLTLSTESSCQNSSVSIRKEFSLNSKVQFPRFFLFFKFLYNFGLFSGQDCFTLFLWNFS